MRSAEGRLGRFSAVGLMGAGLQLLLMCPLTNFGFLSVTAIPIAVEMTILHNFIWHERFTWRDRGSKVSCQIAARLWRFHAGNGLIWLGGNTILAYCLLERLKAPAMPITIGAIALCSVVNFLVADRWVFVSRNRETNDRRGNL